MTRFSFVLILVACVGMFIGIVFCTRQRCEWRDYPRHDYGF